MKAKPDVFNQETIPRLYKDIRRGANYNIVCLLKNIKEKEIFGLNLV